MACWLLMTSHTPSEPNKRNSSLPTSLLWCSTSGKPLTWHRYFYTKCICVHYVPAVLLRVIPEFSWKQSLQELSRPLWGAPYRQGAQETQGQCQTTYRQVTIYTLHDDKTTGLGDTGFFFRLWMCHRIDVNAKRSWDYMLRTKTGLWSIDRGTAAPSRESTQRESPV